MGPFDSALDESLFDAVVAEPPRLDPGYRPLALGVRGYRLAARGGADSVAIGLEQSPENVATARPGSVPRCRRTGADNVRYVTYMLDGMLWAAGGRRATLGGPKDLCEAVAAGYAPDGPGKFEHEIMSRAFDRPFEVVVVGLEDVPSAKKRPMVLGGHLDGCRIGFDLGASDYKVAAVQNGQVLFSTEIPWNPKVGAESRVPLPAASMTASSWRPPTCPSVDAIGGSSAGILVDNQVMVASLFRAVPDDMFEAGVRPIFLQLQQEWGVPLDVINDGDITALAGGLSLEETGILGIALGSSEAVGYLDLAGHITGWLNELAFGPVDANPEGGVDDWSGNPGVGAAYFSQQAVNRLAGPAGFTFPDDMPLADRLKIVQTRMEEGDPAAREIFDTIGVYLGYTVPWYAEFYDMKHVMILGRVTSGAGGERILARARYILATEFPEIDKRISIFLPDERSRRVGQAVAAASLPPAEREVHNEPPIQSIRRLPVRACWTGHAGCRSAVSPPRRRRQSPPMHRGARLLAPSGRRVDHRRPSPRLRRELAYRVAVVAVTQGSKVERRAERLAELRDATSFLGFELITTGDGGLT